MQVNQNFLEEKYISSVVKDLVWNPNFPWYFLEEVNSNQTEEQYKTHWYGSHTGYINDTPLSDLHRGMIKAMKKIPDFHTTLKVKANFYPQTHEIIEHARHVDYEFECKGAILSLNTCDGFTRLEDGTKIPSIRNQMLLFDASKEHNSSTTTNAKGRFNININYL